MEISRVGNNLKVSSEKKAISSKKDFSESFNFAQGKKSEEELKNMFEEIKKKGSRLVVTKCYSDVKAYKKLLQGYLKSILDYMYSLKKDISFWQTQYYITVDTIDKKMQELAESLINDQKKNLDIAGTIDEITGLLVDIYK
jgi:uncharacterized protein